MLPDTVWSAHPLTWRLHLHAGMAAAIILSVVLAVISSTILHPADAAAVPVMERRSTLAFLEDQLPLEVTVATPDELMSAAAGQPLRVTGSQALQVREPRRPCPECGNLIAPTASPRSDAFPATLQRCLGHDASQQPCMPCLAGRFKPPPRPAASCPSAQVVFSRPVIALGSDFGSSGPYKVSRRA